MNVTIGVEVLTAQALLVQPVVKIAGRELVFGLFAPVPNPIVFAVVSIGGNSQGAIPAPRNEISRMVERV
jgi:hypothetical protein